MQSVPVGWDSDRTTVSRLRREWEVSVWRLRETGAREREELSVCASMNNVKVLMSVEVLKWVPQGPRSRFF